MAKYVARSKREGRRRIRSISAVRTHHSESEEKEAQHERISLTKVSWQRCMCLVDVGRLISLERNMGNLHRKTGMHRDGEVTSERELSSSSSYFQMRNLGALVISVTVTTIQIWLKK